MDGLVSHHIPVKLFYYAPLLGDTVKDAFTRMTLNKFPNATGNSTNYINPIDPPKSQEHGKKMKCSGTVLLEQAGHTFTIIFVPESTR